MRRSDEMADPRTDFSRDPLVWKLLQARVPREEICKLAGVSHHVVEAVVKANGPRVKIHRGRGKGGAWNVAAPCTVCGSNSTRLPDGRCVVCAAREMKSARSPIASGGEFSAN